MNEVIPFTYEDTNVRPIALGVGVELSFNPAHARVHVGKQSGHTNRKVATATVKNRKRYVSFAVEVSPKGHIFNAGFPRELFDGFAVECGSGFYRRPGHGREFLGGLFFLFNTAHVTSIAI